jgi:hypothetical protein
MEIDAMIKLSTRWQMPLVLGVFLFGFDLDPPNSGAWCANDPDLATITCAYNTFAQCRAAAAGDSTIYCMANPNKAEESRQPRPAARAKHRHPN